MAKFRDRKPMLLVEKGQIVGTCVTREWVLDSKVPFKDENGKLRHAWLRSQTWTAAEMVRGRRSEAIKKVAKMAEELPLYVALTEQWE